MQWTDRVRQVKIGLVVAAAFIAVASLWVSHILVEDLSDEERNRMEIWAQALHALNNADENTDLSLVLNIIQANNTIPVIVLDPSGHVMDYRNVNIEEKDAMDYRDVNIEEKDIMDYRNVNIDEKDIMDYRNVNIDEKDIMDNRDVNIEEKDAMDNRDVNIKEKDVMDYRNVSIKEKDAMDNRDMKSIEGRAAEDSLAYVAELGRQLYKRGKFIKIDYGTNRRDYQLVCYDESTMLKRLYSYPYVQLGVVLIFVVVAIFALLSSKRAEQNKVWVGLSKETAHQLGTPISSLMAWVEILKESYPDDTLIPEMDKDVRRLERIAERFSKIGSLPEPVDASMNEVLEHTADYMDRRTSSQVNIVKCLPDHDVVVKMNASLFEWVIENLCKNAVDAMEGQGCIWLTLLDEGSKVVVEVRDNGKGIKRKDIKNVFKPGFTTKKRGWGLGLSLAKRIVEEYHKGRIYVRNSEVGKGTTFRIELQK